MLSYSAMTMADTFFVSAISPAALAGVGLAGVAFFTLLCFSLGLLRGIKVLVSQAVGAGRPEEAGRHLSAGLTVGLGLSILTMVLAEVGAPLLHSLAASPEAGGHATLYLRLRMLGAPAFMVFVALREASYGQGDSRSPMKASVVGNLVNIGLDYVFVVFCGYGVAGVALATVIASFIEVGLLIGFRMADVRALVRPHTVHIAALWRIGVPTGFQFLLEVGSFSLLTAMISSMSEVEMAAHQIVLQIIHFSFLPGNAVGEAASVMAGQAVGARREDLILGVARRAMFLACAYTGLCTLLLLLGAPILVAVFNAEGELGATALNLIYVASLFLVADGANVVARGVLRGTGDVRVPALIGIASAWLLTPPLTWFLGYELGYGAVGGWLGLSAEIFIGAAVLWWRLLGGGWQRSASLSRDVIMNAPEPSTA